jgi:tRNA threonylcarbamoyl adenosine modification protein (Sua5/YciO/YrdC/YwlC family)
VRADWQSLIAGKLVSVNQVIVAGVFPTMLACVHVRVRPTWIRMSDFNQNPPRLHVDREETRQPVRGAAQNPGEHQALQPSGGEIMETLTNDETGLQRAAELIKSGGLVLWPSGGVYGLAGRAQDRHAVDKIYAIKSRERGKPLAVMAHRGNAAALGTIDELAGRLLGSFWPGYLGLVVPKTTQIPAFVNAGLASVALVCPNDVAAGLSRLVDEPIAATSANLSGRAEIVDQASAAAQFDGLVDAILTSPPMSGTLNTILDLTTSPPRVLRHGGVTVAQLRSFGVGELRPR